LAQVRAAVTEYGILPLGSQYIHERVPHTKSMLLYGPQSTGKTLLSHVRALAASVVRALAHNLNGNCHYRFVSPVFLSFLSLQMMLISAGFYAVSLFQLCCIAAVCCDTSAILLLKAVHVSLHMASPLSFYLTLFRSTAKSDVHIQFEVLRFSSLTSCSVIATAHLECLGYACYVLWVTQAPPTMLAPSGC
jgi:hypothetical protein